MAMGRSRGNAKITIAAVVLCIHFCACGLHSQQKTQVSAAQQAQIAALKELRDSGVITAQEYRSKVQALQPAASVAAAKTAATSQRSRSVHLAQRRYSFSSIGQQSCQNQNRFVRAHD
jgi:hypothetical protein